MVSMQILWHDSVQFNSNSIVDKHVLKADIFHETYANHMQYEHGIQMKLEFNKNHHFGVSNFKSTFAA